MVALDLAFVVVVAVTVGLGAMIAARWRAPGGGPQAWADASAIRFGGVPSAIAILVGGWVIAIAVMVPLGIAGRASASGFDRPIYRWVSAHAGGPQTHVGKVMSTLTQMGNRNVVELVTLAGVIILAIAYGRRWWLPIIAIAAAVAMQREGQSLLTHLVHRVPPPVAGAGVFPSGGVSRVFAVYGVLAVLAVLLLPETQQHRWRARALNGVILFSVVEAYTRVYTSTHWTSDAITGLIFGALLLIVETTAVHALMRVAVPDRVRPRSDARPSSSRRTRSAGTALVPPPSRASEEHRPA